MITVLILCFTLSLYFQPSYMHSKGSFGRPSWGMFLALSFMFLANPFSVLSVFPSIPLIFLLYVSFHYSLQFLLFSLSNHFLFLQFISFLPSQFLSVAFPFMILFNFFHFPVKSFPVLFSQCLSFSPVHSFYVPLNFFVFSFKSFLVPFGFLNAGLKNRSRVWWCFIVPVIDTFTFFTVKRVFCIHEKWCLWC